MINKSSSTLSALYTIKLNEKFFNLRPLCQQIKLIIFSVMFQFRYLTASNILGLRKNNKIKKQRSPNVHFGILFEGTPSWRRALHPGRCLSSLAEICKEVKALGFRCSAEMPEAGAWVSTARQHTPPGVCVQRHDLSNLLCKGFPFLFAFAITLSLFQLLHFFFPQHSLFPPPSTLSKVWVSSSLKGFQNMIRWIIFGI